MLIQGFFTAISKGTFQISKCGAEIVSRGFFEERGLALDFHEAVFKRFVHDAGFGSARVFTRFVDTAHQTFARHKIHVNVIGFLFHFSFLIQHSNKSNYYIALFFTASMMPP